MLWWCALGTTAGAAAAADQRAVAPWNLAPHLIPGASNLTMTVYGSPTVAADLAAFVAFMRDNDLGQGLDQPTTSFLRQQTWQYKMPIAVEFGPLLHRKFIWFK